MQEGGGSGISSFTGPNNRPHSSLTARAYESEVGQKGGPSFPQVIPMS